MERDQHNRRREIAVYVSLIAELGPIRVDEETAIDVIWALSGPEMYRALVLERGWPVERYVETMHQLVERFGIEAVPAAGTVDPGSADLSRR